MPQFWVKVVCFEKFGYELFGFDDHVFLPLVGVFGIFGDMKFCNFAHKTSLLHAEVVGTEMKAYNGLSAQSIKWTRAKS